MLSVARKNLFAEKTRLIISVGGVAFSVMLILLLQGVYNGWEEKITMYIDSVNADLWVVQEGTQDMFHTPSIIPEDEVKNVLKINGVNSVNKLYVLRTMGETIDRSEKSMLFVIGFNNNTGIGGPTKIIEGLSNPSDSEIIIDQVLAKNRNLKIGDRIKIFGQEMNIVGISSGGDMAMAQIVYIGLETAKKLLKFENLVSYFLVGVDKDIDFVKEEIDKNIENVDILTTAEFSENNKKLILGSFLPILTVLVIVGFIIGIAVIGLTVYTLTQEKSREYGILKAIGSKNKVLYLIVFQQSIISSVMGFLVGIGLTYLVAFVAENNVPEFVTKFTWLDFGRVLLATILMGIVASYIPIKKISRIDPAIVFKN